MDSKNSCIAAIKAASGELLSDREAAELLREMQTLVDDRPAFRGDVDELLAQVQDAVNRKIGANELYDMQVETQAKLSMYHLVTKSDTMRARAEMPEMSLDEERALQAGRITVEELFAKGRKRMGVTKMMHEQQQSLVAIVGGTKSMAVSRIYDTLESNGLYNQWAQTNLAEKALRSAMDGAEADSPSTKAVAQALADTDRLLKAEMRRLGIPVADDISLLYTARSVDPARLDSLTKQGFIDLGKSLNLKKEYMQRNKLADLDKFFGDMYDDLMKQDGHGLDYNHVNYLASSAKAAKAADRFSVLSSLPFADSESFIRYVNATSDQTVAQILESRLKQAGSSLGLMKALGPRPGPTLKAIMNSLSDIMTLQEREFFLNQDPQGVPFNYHTAADNKVLALPATDAANVPVKQSVATRDYYELDDELFKKRYGMAKSEVKSFTSLTEAHKYGQKTKSDLLKNTLNLMKTLGIRQPRPSTLVATLTGELSTPVNPSFAALGSTYRGVVSAPLLKWATALQVGDTAIQAQHLQRQYGVNFAKTGVNNLAAMFPNSQRKRSLAQWGIAIDGITSQLRQAHDDVGYVPPTLDKMIDFSYKVNGLQLVDNALRRSSVELALDAAITAVQEGRFGDEALAVFSRYGLNDRELLERVFTEAAITLPDGRKMLDRSMVEVVAPTEVSKIYAAIRQIEMDSTMVPAEFERAMISLGTRPGTLSGEILRFLGQFKSFPIMMHSRIAPRIVKDAGIAGLASVFATIMALNYVSDSIKKKAQGRDPLPLFNARTWFEIAVRSGALGIADLAVDPTNPTAVQATSRFVGPGIGAAFKQIVGGLAVPAAISAAIAGDDDDFERNMKKVWKGVGTVVPSGGPILNARVFGGRSLIDIVTEEAMGGVPELWYMIDPDERERTERRIQSQQEKQFAPFQLEGAPEPFPVE